MMVDLKDVDIFNLIEDLESIGRMARETVDSGGREEFDPRGVEGAMEIAVLVRGR